MKKFLAIFVVMFVAATVAFAGPRGGRGCGGGGCRPAPCRPGWGGGCRPCPPRPCPPRPYGPGCGYGYGWNCSRDLGNAAAITSIVANGLAIANNVLAPAAYAAPVAPIVQPTVAAPVAPVAVPAQVAPVAPVACAAPQVMYPAAPAPAIAPAVVAPYGRAGAAVYYGR